MAFECLFCIHRQKEGTQKRVDDMLCAVKIATFSVALVKIEIRKLKFELRETLLFGNKLRHVYELLRSRKLKTKSGRERHH